MSQPFNLKRVAMLVTLNCSLNCKLCGAYAPYYERSIDFTVSQHMEDVKKFFEIVDHLELFTISGGEPLLYKYLPEFLDELYDYSDRFDKLEIITNGTIVPDQRLLTSVKQYKGKFSRFLVDNYNASTKIPEIRKVLEENNTPHVIREYNLEKLHCDGWVDYGKLDSVIHDDNETEALFKKCASVQKLSFCFSIHKGYVTPCGPVRWRFGLGKASSDECLNLMDPNISVEEQRRKITNMYSGKFLDTCRFCNGICEDSPRFSPAEQLTTEELCEVKKHYIKPIWSKS